MFEAVIFDFDGVVGNTMGDNYNAWFDAFSKYGVSLEPIEYYLLEGMGRFQIASFFIQKYQLDPLIEQSVVDAKEENYIKNNRFSLYPEITEIFKLLNDKSIKTAIVTGASRYRLMSSLEPAILNRLSATVTADDVVRCKPDPQPYLKAVSQLEVLPEQCVVIENARLGIISAKTAGATCFAIETTLSKEYLENADEIFNNHSMLLSRMREIFK